MVNADSPPYPLLERTIDRFWETIPPLWGSIRAHIRSVSTETYDITFEQFHIMRHISRGTLSMSELANAKNISRPAISQAVNLLVNNGLIVRRRKDQDRRRIELELTIAGEKLLEAVFQDTRAWMRSRLAGLAHDELEIIVRALDCLQKVNLERS
jgi:DNA-binding MarR family transcriptional regulator